MKGGDYLHELGGEGFRRTNLTVFKDLSIQVANDLIDLIFLLAEEECMSLPVLTHDLLNFQANHLLDEVRDRSVSCGFRETCEVNSALRNFPRCDSDLLRSCVCFQHF